MTVTPETKLVHESLNRSPRHNWVEDAGQLPAYIQHIANDLEQERGIPLSRAIPIAIGTVKRWARGGGNVNPDTVAKAQAAVAEWEALKAKNRARQIAKSIELDLDFLEEKVVRHVRTDAGVRRFKQPKGSIIIRDGSPALPGLTSVRSDADGFEKVHGHDGHDYWIGPADDGKSFVVWDEKDNPIIETDTEEQAYQALSKKMPKQPVTVRRMTAKERAAGKKPVKPSAIPDAPKDKTNYKKVKSDSDGFVKYHGDDGNDYYVDSEQFEGSYAVYDPKDNVLAEGATQADALAELQKIVQENVTQQGIEKRRSEQKAPASSSEPKPSQVATAEPTKDGKTIYRVTDPDGKVHEQRSSRKFTHVLIRRNKGEYDRHYFVSWASSKDNAEREARVKPNSRDHVSIVPVQSSTPSGDAKPSAQPYKVISKKGQKARVEYNGKQYYFCAPECKEKFDRNPQQYAKKTA